jgi:DNA repair protein RadC
MSIDSTGRSIEAPGLSCAYLIEESPANRNMGQGDMKSAGKRSGGLMRPCTESVPICRWPEEERPRDLLISHGTESLPLSKLLAIILRTGRTGVNAEEISRRLLNCFSGLRGLDAASISDICGIEGIGPAKAAQIKAALEIGRRLFREKAKDMECIDDSRRALEYAALYFGPYLRDAESESAHLILLNRKHRPIRIVELCRGSVGSVAVDAQRIVREALRASASSLVLVHNHPSGDGTPSEKDIRLTHAIRDACGLFGIRLLDHVIVGKAPQDDESFVRRGLL